MIRACHFIIALALIIGLAGLVWFVSRPEDPVIASTSGAPAFEVNVEKPRRDRFLGGILPTKIEAKLIGGELRFDHASPGAKVGSVAHHRLELSADGWDLLIETDGKGRDRSGDAPRVPDRDRGETVYPALPTRRSGHWLSPRHHASGLRRIRRPLPRRARPMRGCRGRGRSSIRKPGVIQATRGRRHRSPSAGAS